MVHQRELAWLPRLEDNIMSSGKKSGSWCNVPICERTDIARYRGAAREKVIL